MSGLAIWAPLPYQDDTLFDQASPLNRDDCLSPFRALRDVCAGAGAEVHTQDVWLRSGRTPSAVLFPDRPRAPLARLLGPWHGRSRPYLLLQECAVVSPRNWDLAAHREYVRVFTWHSDLLANPLYARVHFAQRLAPPAVDGWDARPGWCCLIAANKRSSHVDELYSQRLAAIRWFERHHPERFSLFGIGWDRPLVPGPAPLGKVIARTPLLRRAWIRDRPSYRGPIASKRACLLGHRFSVCFENAQRIPGYITEKIIDCFMAGCVPLYWGAPDIADHIPAECFIDFRAFSGFADAYAFMAAMSAGEFQRHQQAMADFLASAAADRFSSDFFARQIAGAIFPKGTVDG